LQGSDSIHWNKGILLIQTSTDIQITVSLAKQDREKVNSHLKTSPSILGHSQPTAMVNHWQTTQYFAIEVATPRMVIPRILAANNSDLSRIFM
jgi:hypothetical protein